jgi:H+/Cl- antiporter ClcA
MGLQYFEALSPGTIASIIAVLVNRLVTGNDVTGMFRYPFLSFTLPSSIFFNAIIYGLYGSFIGVLYTIGMKYVKTSVHEWFNPPHPLASDNSVYAATTVSVPVNHEATSLMGGKFETYSIVRRSTTVSSILHKVFCVAIPYKPYRAALTGAIAGASVGVIGLFLPHTMFWGEAQLQNLIDNGRTPLPIFGSNDDLTVFALCMIDPTDQVAIQAGFGIGCSALLALSKTIATGLSLGTGIVGGAFWAPLVIGCAASHGLTDLIDKFHAHFGFGHSLAAHPCVVILCTMGAAHVGECLTLPCGLEILSFNVYARLNLSCPIILKIHDSTVPMSHGYNVDTYSDYFSV